MSLFLFGFHSRQYGRNVDGRLLYLLVGSQAIVDFLMSGNLEERTRFGVFDGRNGRENFLDALFHPGYVEVAYYGNGL